jgi:hypothetical protein
MVTDDLNGDSMGDIVVGYANGYGGILSVRLGNVQAIAPTGEVFEGITAGRYPSPFLPEARLYALPEPPDFLQVGDFDADGYDDVLAAARGGSTLYLLCGNLRGTLGKTRSFEVDGTLTALQAYDSKQPGVFTPLALGIRTSDGPQTLIYGSDGLAGGAESYVMPADVTALAFGQLDGDVNPDLAAATANQIIVIHGSGDRADQDTASAIERQDIPIQIMGLAVGDFVFDRNHQREIAALSADGTVYFSAWGHPDTRPYTYQEKNAIHQLKRSLSLDRIDMETFTLEANKMIRPNRSMGCILRSF